MHVGCGEHNARIDAIKLLLLCSHVIHNIDSSSKEGSAERHEHESLEEDEERLAVSVEWCRAIPIAFGSQGFPRL